MNPLDVVVRVSVILSIALVGAMLLRAKSAALRHWILSAAIVCAVLTPVLVPFAPAWHVPLPTRSAAFAAVPRPIAIAVEATQDPQGVRPVGVPAVSDSGPQLSALQVIGAIWLIGTAIASLMLSAGLIRLSCLRTRSRLITDGSLVSMAADVAAAFGIRRPIRLLQSNRPSTLFTWGHFRPTVILPRDAGGWSPDRAHIVLCHELAHVRRGDWLVLMAAEMLKAIYWFNPLVWIVGKRVRDESERACDDEVMSQGVTGTEYASELLSLARLLNAERPGWVAASAMARPSSLERRVTAMVSSDMNRQPVGRTRRALTFIVLLLLAVVVGGFTTAAQSFASYSGSVLDPTGNIVTGVTLTVTNNKTKQKYEVKSSDTGAFEFVGLTPGEYQLETFSPGFRNLKMPLTIGNKNIRSDIRMEVGSLEETITVIDRGEPRVEGAEPTARGYKWPPDKAACTTKPTGGYIAQPTKLQDARPIYPRSGGVPKAASVVVLDARIGTDGSVVEARGVDPAADPDLVAAAAEAVKLWKYSPTLLNCIPIEVQMKVTVNFRTE